MAQKGKKQDVGEEEAARPSVFAELEENGNISVTFNSFEQFPPRIIARAEQEMQRAWHELQAQAVQARRISEHSEELEKQRRRRLADKIGPRALTEEEEKKYA